MNINFKNNKGGLFLFVGIVLTFAAPFVLTRPAFLKCLALDDNSFAAIGNTIGGITAPIVGLIGAWLIYLTLIEQIRTNNLSSILSSFQNVNDFLFQSGLLEFDDEIKSYLKESWEPFDDYGNSNYLNNDAVTKFAQRHFYPALNASLQINILTKEIDKAGTDHLKARVLSIIELFKQTHAYQSIMQSGIIDQKGNNYFTPEHNIKEALDIANKWGIELPKLNFSTEEEVLNSKD